jgi:hypothetical protein
MKKLINVLFISALLIFSGCSSSDDSDDMDAQLSPENSFSVTIDDIVYTFDTFFASKEYDNYQVAGLNGNEEGFIISFNQNGVIEKATFFRPSVANFDSSFYNPDFDLTNLTFDMSQNIVSANFSGNIYQGAEDVLNSASKVVQSGSFNLVFTEEEADPIRDVFIDATINGSLYESVKHFRNGNGSSTFEYIGISDGTLILSIIVDTDTVQEGTFDFTSDSPINKFNVQYFDPFIETDNYEQLSVSGTLVIDSVIDDVFSFVLLQGRFSGTATSINGDVYNIENGAFNVSL